MAATFDNAKLQFTDQDLYNILTGRLFQDNVKRDILSIHVKGKQLNTKNLLLKGFGESQQSAFELH